MIFESVNYSHLLQDFVFSMGAGFAAGFINQVLSAFFPSGKKGVFFRDIIACLVFTIVVFSYVISFTNYPIIRIYHILGGIAGYLSFPYRFSIYSQKILKKFFGKFKNKIWCFAVKIKSTICARRQKSRLRKEQQQKTEQQGDLKTEEVWVYNL